MSKHLYKTKYQNHPVLIQMGWDKPLQGFYMTICFLDDEDNDTDYYLYNNLEDEISHPQTLTQFYLKLQILDLAVPEDMKFALEVDKCNNTVNEVRDWGSSYR